MLIYTNACSIGIYYNPSIRERRTGRSYIISSYKTFNRAIAKSPSIFMIEINVSIVPAFKSQGVENS